MITELNNPVEFVRVFDTGGVLPAGLRRLKVNRSYSRDFLSSIGSAGYAMSDYIDTI